jgi:hypothetical protein
VKLFDALEGTEDILTLKRREVICIIEVSWLVLPWR